MFKKILVPLDIEERSLNARAITVAEDLAAQYGATITALSVIPDINDNPLVASYFPDDAGKKAYESACADFQKIIEHQFARPGEVRCAIAVGSARKEILKYAEEKGIDLIVMPARKNDISKLLLGSNTRYVAENAPCSVLVVRP